MRVSAVLPELIDLGGELVDPLVSLASFICRTTT